MATDRYALGEISFDFAPTDDCAEFVEKYPNMLLPFDSATLISPSKGNESTVELMFSEQAGDKYGYRFSDRKLALFSLKNAEPLTYAALKTNAESKIENSVKVSTKELQKAINIISTLAITENEIYLEISDNSFVVHDSSKSNKLKVQSEDNKVAEKVTIKFIRSVLTEAISPVSTEKVALKFGDQNSAFIFIPVLDTGTEVDNVFVLAIPSS
jgi:DNA polymerase III sliding clamp (beta) subunit (PCNA family)